MTMNGAPVFLAYPKISFIIFVDRIFTNLFEPLFTNVFDVSGRDAAICCV